MSGIRYKSGKAQLPEDHMIEKVLFVCNTGFIERLMTDLKTAGWTENMLTERISAHRLLYVTAGKFLIKPKPMVHGANTLAD
jgi:hypothetical protein